MDSTPPAFLGQEPSHTDTLALAVRIISAHVAHNRVHCSELPSLIQ